MNGEIAPARIMITAKGPAAIVLTDGQNTTLHTTFPVPPGTPLSGMLEGGQHVLQVKVHGCRRVVPSAGQGEDPPVRGVFEVTGRWVNLSREARLILLG